MAARLSCMMTLILHSLQPVRGAVNFILAQLYIGVNNMPVWYPSKKMQCIIKAESTKVEFPFLLQAEHDQEILEVWDQPPSIPLAYLDRRGRLQQPLHTADYFLFRD